MKKPFTWFAIVGLLALGFIATKWPALQFSKLQAGDFASRLGILVVLATLIERTVEVFLTIWRSEESYKREAEVKRLISAGVPSTDPALVAAQNLLQEYKSQTLRCALPLSFSFGFLMACFGVRILSQFVILPAVGSPDMPAKCQLFWFHFSDIVFTATMLAGGADPIHKLMDVFRKFMEASAAKANGTAK